jgi:two-component system, LuxR family, sensor kinase FixL
VPGPGEPPLELAQEPLRAGEELYRYIIDLSGLVPWTANGSGEVLAVGSGWTRWTGADTSTALDSGWLDFVHPDDLPNVRTEWLSAVQSSDRLTIRWRLRFADQGYRWIEGRTRKRTDGRSGPTLWYGTLQDVHDEQMIAETHGRLRAELIHVSRLNAMGAMASVIAHDLNQPLTAAAHFVRGTRQLLSRGEAEIGPLLAALDDADRNIVRSAEIVRRMREFVSRGDVERRPESLKEVVDEACGFALADAAARGISHHAVYASQCTVFVDRVQVQQVLVNLLRNAVQAVADMPRREISIATSKVGKGECEVRISDTGPGISDDAATRLFDPFYTTRKDGTGLGLAISRMIVEAHGGTIWMGPREGGGTVVGFTLPTVEAPADAPAPEAGA